MAVNSIYRTEDFEFDFSKKEIRFFRKGFNFTTISFNEVNYIEVRKGSTVRNVWFLAIISGLLILLTILLSDNLFERLSEIRSFASLNHSDLRRIGANILILASSLFFALYILYGITKNEIVLKINRKNNPYPLTELAKEGVQEQFYKDLNYVFPFTKFDFN